MPASWYRLSFSRVSPLNLFHFGKKARLGPAFRGILEEYLRVLSYPKFQLSEAEIKSLTEEELLPYVEVVNPRRRLRVVERDPSDNKFLECAMTGKARVIISGDKDLLSIGRYRSISIQSPAKFLAANPHLRRS
jgi:uncharacterized protein